MTLVLVLAGRGGLAQAQSGMESELFGRGATAGQEPAPKIPSENPADPQVYTRLGLEGDPEFRSALETRRNGVAIVAIGASLGGLAFMTGLVVNGLANMSWGPSTPGYGSSRSSNTPDSAVALMAVGGIVAVTSVFGGVMLHQRATARMRAIYERKKASAMPQVSLGAGPQGGGVTARWSF
jgi:hypothetical protein